jgi:hypothetical protein
MTCLSGNKNNKVSMRTHIVIRGHIKYEHTDSNMRTHIAVV